MATRADISVAWDPGSTNALNVTSCPALVAALTTAVGSSTGDGYFTIKALAETSLLDAALLQCKSVLCFPLHTKHEVDEGQYSF